MAKHCSRAPSFLRVVRYSTKDAGSQYATWRLRSSGSAADWPHRAFCGQLLIYRHWSHLHSTIVGPKHSAFAKRACEDPCTGAIYHFYANAKAMEGFLNGGKFADGSIIADEVLETHQLKGGSSKEGPRRGVGVMVKDSQLYASTGGWGFGAFDGDSQVQSLSTQERNDCYQ